MACSEDKIASVSDNTLFALQQKHPPPHPDSIISPLPDNLIQSVIVSVEEVARAVKSFPGGSAGGPDGCGLST